MSVSNSLVTPHIPYSGKIHLILGPMYAGKTSLLIRRYRRYSVAGKKCLLIKHQNDTRYDENMLCTHDLNKVDAQNCTKLLDIVIDPSYQVICIDEIQFYPDNVEFCEKMAKAGLIVEASGLSGNFMREQFPNIGSLMAKADTVEFLTAVCMVCMAEGAAFTKRLSAETAEVIIGGTDKYVAVCRECYHKE